MRSCPIWRDLYASPVPAHTVIKNGFLYAKNKDKEWRLVLPSTFKFDGKNYLELAIAEAHEATAHGGIEKTMKALTDKFECQSFSKVVKEYIASCDTCQRTKYSNQAPVGLVVPLHVPQRPWTDISMDFLKLSPVFTKCCSLYANIPSDEDHMLCISRLWTIVERHSGFKFLIPVHDKLTAEQCTGTFDTHVFPTMGYPFSILFDRDTLFMSDHFQNWARKNGIKLEPCTSYQPQTDRQLEIVNKEILQVARACKAEGDE